MKRSEQEGFGEATPGQAQSENPPADPEMIRDEAEDESAANEEAPEEAAEDQDAGPTKTAEEVERDPERDQAEG